MNDEFTKNIKAEELIKVKQNKYLLKCASCEKKLVEIYTTPEIPGKIKIKCICPYCGDSSFVKEVESKFFISPINLCVTDIKEGIIYVDKIHKQS